MGLPFALAFTAGLVATVNPCGFAMLPAYLSYFMGLEDGDPTPVAIGVWRGLRIGAVVTAGFLTVFGLAGVLITLGVQALVAVVPWAAMVVGVGVAGFEGADGRGHRGRPRGAEDPPRELIRFERPTTDAETNTFVRAAVRADEEITVALMVGSGPFGREPAGVFNFEVDAPKHRLYLERSPRRIRAVIDGEVVADSTDARLLHETGLMPVYYLPRADVREELLERSETSTHCPFKGDATYWHVRTGEHVRRDALWAYPEPLEGAPPLADLVAFAWDAVDAWYEEAERIGVHPRDPYHRCDVIRSDRHVTIRVDGHLVAESDRARLLFETGLPPRYYLPAEDVDASLLEESDTVTRCPYKGTTSRFHSIRVGDRLVEDAIWVYDEPNDEVRGVAGLLAFYDDRVDIQTAPTRWVVPEPDA